MRTPWSITKSQEFVEEVKQLDWEREEVARRLREIDVQMVYNMVLMLSIIIESMLSGELNELYL